MTFQIKIKSPAKRRPILQDTPYSIPTTPTTLRELLTAITQKEVETYNARGLENMLVPFLSEEEIAVKSTTGKVGFGRIYSDNKAVPEEAVAATLQAFEDGLFRVVINETEATTLDTPINIEENDVITFVRLTFLAGRLW